VTTPADMESIKRTELPRHASNSKRAIGAILFEQGRLQPQDIETIQRHAAEHGIRFGDAAMQLNLVTQQEIEAALAHQFQHAVLARGIDGVADEVVAAYDPQNELVEPIRALRTQLMFSWLNNASRNVLAITSPDRGEGRSWLAANLAVAFSQMGERTLLIDADMRHPHQHRFFNLDNSLGLSGLLSGRVAESPAPRIHPQLRLFVFPAGNAPPNPQELLARPTFEIIISRFATQYDVVLIDTPAAADTADAQLIAAAAGAAVMVARRDHSRHARLKVAMQRLKTAAVNIVGCVLNEH
jgi:protein-tyrosine kinase